MLALQGQAGEGGAAVLGEQGSASRAGNTARETFLTFAGN